MAVRQKRTFRIGHILRVSARPPAGQNNRPHVEGDRSRSTDLFRSTVHAPLVHSHGSR